MYNNIKEGYYRENQISFNRCNIDTIGIIC